jgi:hypothetical protein
MHPSFHFASLPRAPQPQRQPQAPPPPQAPRPLVALSGLRRCNAAVSAEVVRRGLWFRVHAPLGVGDLRGNDKALRAIEVWLAAMWAGGEGVKQVLLVHGPPGVGKSVACRLLAQAAGYRVVEFNAAEERTEGAVVNGLLPLVSCAIQPTAVLVEEVDGVYGGSDSAPSGLAALQRVLGMASARTPIICCCNDRWNKIVFQIARFCKEVGFLRMSNAAMVAVAARAYRLAGFPVDLALVRTAIGLANGDARLLLGMLQFYRQRGPAERGFDGRLLVTAEAMAFKFDEEERARWLMPTNRPALKHAVLCRLWDAASLDQRRTAALATDTAAEMAAAAVRAFVSTGDAMVDAVARKRLCGLEAQARAAAIACANGLPAAALLQRLEPETVHEAQEAYLRGLGSRRTIACLERQMGGFDALDAMVFNARRNGEIAATGGSGRSASVADAGSRASLDVVASNYPRLADHWKLVRGGCSARDGVLQRKVALQVQHDACLRMAAAADCLSEATHLQDRAWNDSDCGEYADQRVDAAVQAMFPGTGAYAAASRQRPTYTRECNSFQNANAAVAVSMAVRVAGSRFPCHNGPPGMTVTVPRREDLLHYRDVFLQRTALPCDPAADRPYNPPTLPGTHVIADFVRDVLTFTHNENRHAAHKPSADTKRGLGAVDTEAACGVQEEKGSRGLGLGRGRGLGGRGRGGRGRGGRGRGRGRGTAGGL